MKKGSIAITLLLVLSLLVGCGSETKKTEESAILDAESNGVSSTVVSEEATSSSEAKASKKDTNASVEFTDSVGRKVHLPAHIDRIAPSGSLAQQVLMTIAPEKMVALSAKTKGSDAKRFLGDVSDLPEVGQFYGKGDFNAETLASVKPQVIIDIGEPKKSMKDDMDGVMEKTGIPTIFIEMKMENAGDAYRTLGKLLGVEEKGKKLGDYCDRVYKEVTETVAKIPKEKRVKFALLVGDKGLNAIAKGSFQGEMLELLGENVVAVEEPSAKGSGNEISAEQLTMWNPQIILFGPDSIYDSVAEDPFFSTLTAISSGNFYRVPSVPYNWIGMPPSVNRFLGLQWAAAVFYPEQFGSSLRERVTEYFKLFYHHDLTPEEYKMLTKDSLPRK